MARKDSGTPLLKVRMTTSIRTTAGETSESARRTRVDGRACIFQSVAQPVNVDSSNMQVAPIRTLAVAVLAMPTRSRQRGGTLAPTVFFELHIMKRTSPILRTTPIRLIVRIQAKRMAHFFSRHCDFSRPSHDYVLLPDRQKVFTALLNPSTINTLAS